ncbi:hypothetical protein GTP46_08190 [Duganella sp. FT135W]|uniref:Zf-HC2 domain-containing protein n=1 Tax=Duganella flavida TaxID=2692175 RepID=A0A6L8K540_9BURK|nr:hypothetical protein [Duganella flavida]MYM22623.1 hypothetical protein [Duganella flavida]
MTDAIKKLTCRETTYLVASSRDASLTAQQATGLAAHLDTCSACRIAKSQFTAVFSHLETLLARTTEPDRS